MTKDRKSLAGCLEGMVAYERCRGETANGQRMRIEEEVVGGDCGVAA